ncbi:MULTISPECIES: CobW family GTP-binding protein [Psychrilyobacter]|nr:MULTISPECIES: GTP-binding protein [Psychrilyobacter]MCS5422560.1 GTP-binding protein [Psychrilyobacter sp. S5]NDI78613.1 GTP-binding protein [Psychrilyobacter piezotolerans]
MIEVEIVSGFLGAGKTTFINKRLKELKGKFSEEKIVLIENEFGDISIDSEFIVEGVTIEEISSGCICCVLKENFKESLEKIIENDIDRIIIEPTGLGLLGEILKILKSEKISKKCEIASVTMVIDGKNYLEQVEIFGSFFTDQIENAKTLYISKIDDMNVESISEIEGSLKEINSRAKTIFEIKDIKSMSITDFNIDIERLRDILEELSSEQHGKILRGKGFLENYTFNIVNGEYEIREESMKRNNKLILIGDLDRENIIKLFN